MESLGAATTQFGFDLFKELSKRNSGNVFFSPASISTAIGMLLLGARGATAAQLQKVGGGLPLLLQQPFLGVSPLELPGKHAPLDPWAFVVSRD